VDKPTTVIVEASQPLGVTVGGVGVAGASLIARKSSRPLPSPAKGDSDTPYKTAT